MVENHNLCLYICIYIYIHIYIPIYIYICTPIIAYISKITCSHIHENNHIVTLGSHSAKAPERQAVRSSAVHRHPRSSPVRR